MGSLETFNSFEDIGQPDSEIHSIESEIGYLHRQLGKRRLAIPTKRQVRQFDHRREQSIQRPIDQVSVMQPKRFLFIRALLKLSCQKCYLRCAKQELN